MVNMNKAEAPCRPAASLKFTIDNILNLKTSGRNCDSCRDTGQQDEAATVVRKDAFQSHQQEHGGQWRQDPSSRLHDSGKRVRMIVWLQAVRNRDHLSS